MTTQAGCPGPKLDTDLELQARDWFDQLRQSKSRNAEVWRIILRANCKIHARDSLVDSLANYDRYTFEYDRYGANVVGGSWTVLSSAQSLGFITAEEVREVATRKEFFIPSYNSGYKELIEELELAKSELTQSESDKIEQTKDLELAAKKYAKSQAQTDKLMEHRDALALEAHRNGMSFAKIAKILGMTRSGVQSLLFRESQKDDAEYD